MSRKRQRGFTLIELLVGTAVMGLLMPAVGASIFQMVRGADRINDENVALADVDNAANFLVRDLTLAIDVLDPSTLLPLVNCSTGTEPDIRVQWVDQSGWAEPGNESHYVVYRIRSGTTILERDYDGTIFVAGRSISAVAFCQEADGLIRLDITSASDGPDPSAKTLIFYINQRAEDFTQ